MIFYLIWFVFNQAISSSHFCIPALVLVNLCTDLYIKLFVKVINMFNIILVLENNNNNWKKYRNFFFFFTV